ncbi:MAG: PilZ domain-containing protein [Gammaproteobacteria bacterium]|nr:PilZ domain-containing protein [Gammaproteobacteria bacterium]
MQKKVINKDGVQVIEVLSQKYEPFTNKRLDERFRINYKVFIRLSDGSIVQAQAVDISMGGIYIEYAAPADVGKVFDLAFDLPLANEFKKVLVKARVVRSVVLGSRSLYGLAFVYTEFVNETDKTLEKYMKLRKLQAT